MGDYRIEIRLSGYAREHMRRLLYSASRRFNARGGGRGDPTPAMVVYGPFDTAEPSRIPKAVTEAAAGYDLLFYRVRGFERFEVDRRWIIFNQAELGVCLEFEASEKLALLRRDLARTLGAFCEPAEAASPDGIFRTKVEFDGGDKNVDRFLKHLKDNEAVGGNQRVLRLTVVRDDEVICEYDFARRRMFQMRHVQDGTQIRRALNRIMPGEEALAPIWSKTLASRRRRNRQITLVEDDPAIRLPKLLMPGNLRKHIRTTLRSKSRQATLVDDSPGMRIPRIILSSLPRPLPKPKPAGKSMQAKLSGVEDRNGMRAQNQATGMGAIAAMWRQRGA
jgi:hypothetical protein